MLPKASSDARCRPRKTEGREAHPAWAVNKRREAGSKEILIRFSYVRYFLSDF